MKNLKLIIEEQVSRNNTMAQNNYVVGNTDALKWVRRVIEQAEEDEFGGRKND